MGDAAAEKVPSDRPGTRQGLFFSYVTIHRSSLGHRSGAASYHTLPAILTTPPSPTFPPHPPFSAHPTPPFQRLSAVSGDGNCAGTDYSSNPGQEGRKARKARQKKTGVGESMQVMRVICVLAYPRYFWCEWAL